MINKLRQQLKVQKRTPNNRTPNIRSRNFILNSLKLQRQQKTSSGLRAALGFARWLLAVKSAQETRIAFRSECFITGRSRGTSQRFTVARTKIKELASKARLFGVRKASW